MRFFYALDPLCLIACAGYTANRFILHPPASSPFLHGRFNDLLLIPAALPFMLALQRQLRLRTHDGPPTPGEIFLHFTVWSFVCEGIGPLWFPNATADPWDILAYAAGATFAALWWHRSRWLATHEL